MAGTKKHINVWDLGNDRRHLAALTGLAWTSDGKLFDHR